MKIAGNVIFGIGNHQKTRMKIDTLIKYLKETLL